MTPPRTLPTDEAPLCRRGRHRLTPENLGDGGRCRPCKREYEHHRRRGLSWDGPIVCGVRAVPQRMLPPGRLRELRATVGACVECGWTPDAGPHRCPAGVGSTDQDEVGRPR